MSHSDSKVYSRLAECMLTILITLKTHGEASTKELTSLEKHESLLYHTHLKYPFASQYHFTPMIRVLTDKQNEFARHVLAS